MFAAYSTELMYVQRFETQFEAVSWLKQTGGGELFKQIDTIE